VINSNDDLRLIYNNGFAELSAFQCIAATDNALALYSMCKQYSGVDEAERHPQLK